jgi:shikimate dehydrogenase
VNRLPARLVLLGHPVAHSLSPAFQNAALRSAGIPLTYVVEDVPPEQLPAVVARLRSEDAAGNVTVPHKEKFALLCDRLTTLAERVGAANTYWMEKGELVGDNTDVGGFDFAARELQAEIEGAQVAILGAGGAVAGVLTAIERWPGASAVVWSRTAERSAALTSRFATFARATDSLDDALDRATLVVNATPIGFHHDEMPIPPNALPATAAILDLVYRKGETPWVRACRARGLRAADGLTMLIEQGALAFERWFGVPADREAMWSAVR